MGSYSYNCIGDNKNLFKKGIKMYNNCFILSDLFIILIMIIYVVFGLFSYWFSLNTNRSEVEKSQLPVKILYWHGVYFVFVFIIFSAIVLIYSFIKIHII